MIEVRDLTKCLGKTEILRGISFTLPERCIAGLLGPNGAGKTTTIKVLATLLSPTNGTVSVAGYDVSEAPREVRQRLGYLPEDPPLYEELTVEEQLRLAGGLHGLRGARLKSAMAAAIERCQLQSVHSKMIAKLSKGFRQRVGIAQTILHEPRVIILDEPTNGLDPLQLVEARAIIRSLAESATVLFSSHLLQEVVEVCSRVILIAHGEKLFESEIGSNLGREELERNFVQAVRGER